MELQKAVKKMERKLSQEEVIVDILPALVYAGKSEKKYEDSVMVTNKAIYFYLNKTHKKTMLVADINCITLSILGKELILHSENDDVRMEAENSIKIIKNILQIKEKLLNEVNGLKVHLELQKNLQEFIQKERSNSFFKSLFSSKKSQERKSDSSLSKSKDRNSFSVVEVKDKTFVLEIGKRMYEAVYQNATLLYISGNLGFIFHEQDYRKQVQSDYEVVFRRTIEKEEEIIKLRKIDKRRNSEEQNNKIRRYLQSTKRADYKEQILFAVETNKQFEIMTPVSKTMQSLEDLLAAQYIIPQKDMVSIFYKLFSLAENHSQILCSLSPSRVLIDKQTVQISSAFCVLQAQTNVNYFSPEQIVHFGAKKTTAQVQLINLWKIGLLIYQIAYFCLPYSIQYLAASTFARSKMTVYFPEPTQRSFQLQQFLLLILRQSPQRRGGGSEWKTKIFEHEWITKSRK